MIFDPEFGSFDVHQREDLPAAKNVTRSAGDRAAKAVLKESGPMTDGIAGNALKTRMSALGHKRTFAVQKGMSALGHEQHPSAW
jgi:hypothetical protein